MLKAGCNIIQSEAEVFNPPLSFPIDFHSKSVILGRIQEFWLGGAVKVAVSTDRQNPFFQIHLFHRFNYI